MTRDEIIVAQAEEIAELRRQLALDRIIIDELREQAKAREAGNE